MDEQPAVSIFNDSYRAVFRALDNSKVKNDVKVHRKPQKFNFLPTFFTYFCFKTAMFASVLPGILRVLFHPFVLKPLGSEFYEWRKGLLHEL